MDHNSALREPRREEHGFTMVELMVVVLVVGILIAVALPIFLGARTRAHNRAAQSELRNAVVAADTFFTEDDTYLGFDAAGGESIEASVTWADATVVSDITTVGSVYVTVPGSYQIVLNRISESGSTFCYAKNVSPVAGAQNRGNVASVTVAGCTGTW